MKKRLFVIDGHALCYRAYFAFIKNPLTNSKGQNTSAIFGFARMLFRLLADQKPDYLVVAFDPPRKSFRFALYPEYKANREKMPEDLRSQIEEIKLMVETLGIRRIEEADYEADDVLGSIARSHASKDLEVVLVTGDKDAYQLVDDNTSIYANRKGITEFETYDAAAVREKLGIGPAQVIDYMALVGDASDNIPGVRGVGEKTALKLIQEHGSLDGVYSNLDRIKGKLRETLESNRDMAYLSRDLVTIRTDLPVALNIDETRTPDVHSEAARAFFRSHEMESIARELSGDEDGPGGAPAAGSTARADRDYRIVRNSSELEEAIAEIRAAGMVSVDTETTSVNPVAAELVGISLSVSENAGWYVPVQNRSLFSEECVDRAEALALLKPVLEDASVRKIGQNIKYDIVVFKNAGIELGGVHFDTMIASYLLDPSERRHNMDDMAMKFLNYKTTTFKELVSKGRDTLSITEVPLRELADYAIEDADITLRLHRILSARLEEEDFSRLFHEVEMPLARVLALMELYGVKIDLAHFRALAKENRRLLEETEERIYREAGSRFNINSTRELSAVLFEKLGLKPVRKTKTGYSTDIQVLETLRGSHPIIDDLIAYRTFAKLKSTYIDSLPELVLPSTGRIHTSFNQTVVATGRLSSSDPNLQNIPVRDEFGKKIRRGFVPEKGMLLLSADYSQIELRLAAHLSGDEQMTEAFKKGIDIHALTASSVFGVAMDAVTGDMRRQAKVINFATIYGVSPYGLSQQADISVRDAAEFINRYFETYPGFKRYIDETIAFAREKGYVRTILGRRRPIPDIDSSAQFRREGAERIAINTPIQGTAADLIKVAMIDIQREIEEKNYGGRMIIQVHDELVFEVPADEKERFGSMVREKMEGALELSVPIVVDMGWGDNWGEAH
ncbi:MAG: DNA polymerase I [Spirochaetes bacterium]|nr:DNA polymerase I [Spirochaetota bacterium]